MEELKPIVSFIEEIEKKQVLSKDTKKEEFYITKKDAVEAFKKREDYIKKVIVKFFPPDSYPMELLGFFKEK